MQQLEQISVSEPQAALADAMVDRLEMDRRDAFEIAGYVLGAFAGKEELDDDHLDPDLRSIFYTLEGRRLLSFRREEYRNEEGYIRRAFYWHIRWSEITEGQDTGSTQGRGTGSVYEELPQGAWSRA